MTKPRINLGCGLITYPNEPHWSHGMVDRDILIEGDWVNVDRNVAPGVNEQVDLFTYPWPWEDNSFSLALATHLVEHIPHAPKIMGFNGADELMNAGPYWQKNVVKWRERCEELANLQDGWFCFFSELWRVLEPDGMVHLLVPHAASDGALADPTHTRYVLPQTFGYLQKDPNGQFDYSIGCNFEAPDPAYRITEPYRNLLPEPDDDAQTREQKALELRYNMITRRNVVYEFYQKLTAVKDADSD